MDERHENTDSDIILCLFAIFSCLLVFLLIFLEEERRECAAIPIAILSLALVIAVCSLIKCSYRSIKHAQDKPREKDLR